MEKYDLVRSRRKTLAIHITGDGRVEVRAPLGLSNGEIERFLALKAPWIQRALGRQTGRLASRAAFAPESLRLLGKRLPILPETAGDGIPTPAGIPLPPGPWDEKKGIVERFYRHAAADYLPGRLSLLAEKTGRKPTALTITGARTRWGSCSGKGRIALSWRLMMAPPPAVDYVLIHELCHLWELNHSPRFWAKVTAFCPDWQAQRAVLHALSRELGEEDWG